MSNKLIHVVTVITCIFSCRVLLLAQGIAPIVGRSYVDMDFDWRFSKSDPANAMMAAFDDTNWRTINVPHDWSIEGPFGPDFGSGNGYAPGGVAWYRKHFTIDSSQKGKLVAVEFDGVYEQSQVYINGFVVGGRPYGYSSFQCDLTPYVKFGSDQNVLAVRVDHSRFADSRWYTGSGIYRSVRLRVTDKVHVAYNGIYVTTPTVNDQSATISVETVMENASGRDLTLETQTDVLGPDGGSVANTRSTSQISNGTAQPTVQQLSINRPALWSIESPGLYTLRTRIISGGNVLDEVLTPFGVRTIKFDANKGFSINGREAKIKGVCIHHDAGALGAAVPAKVLERRLKVLKEIGVNAIRTSHNPPAPELLDLCDRMGFVVMDEAFDEFTPAKNKWVQGRNVGVASHWGYADFFNKWAITDIQDMVRRDRNHPSIVIWSVGNEIDYANDPFSHPALGENYRPLYPPAEDLVKLGKPLVEAVKKLDTTRPVSAALATMTMSEAVGMPEILDIVGYNYQESLYAQDHQKHPNRIIYGSENGHQYNNWAVVRDNEYVLGQFLWTGIDYLGEAGRWPTRGSSAGLLDTCGFKKPQAWFRQSLWGDRLMVYLCTPSAASGAQGRGRGRGRMDETWARPTNASNVQVICYTNCEQVQLTLNDKSIGTKPVSEAVDGVLSWNVPFEAGTLKAAGLKNGAAVCEYTMKTAGEAKRIELLADQTQLRADGKDVCHIEFRVVDAQGVLVPDAQNEVTFKIDGAAQLLGIDNGDISGAVDYRSRQQKASRGRGLAIVQSIRSQGKATVTVSSQGLEPATIEIETR